MKQWVCAVIASQPDQPAPLLLLSPSLPPAFCLSFIVVCAPSVDRLCRGGCSLLGFAQFAQCTPLLDFVIEDPSRVRISMTGGRSAALLAENVCERYSAVRRLISLVITKRHLLNNNRWVNRRGYRAIKIETVSIWLWRFESPCQRLHRAKFDGHARATGICREIKSRRW